MKHESYRITRRTALRALALPAFAATGALTQPAWPTRPITVINPYAPGGASDIIMRMLTDSLSNSLGQPVIVDNRPGGGGSLGAGLVAQAIPDGHTLLITNVGPLTAAPALMPDLPYHPVNSFSYISMFGGIPMVCAVRGDSPINSLAEYAAAAAERSEAISFGASGVGSAGHLTGILFSMLANVALLHVPFRGAADTQRAVLGGEIDSIWNTVSAHSGALQARTLKGLSLSSETRMASLPDIPTTGEAGYPGVVATNWVVLSGPAGLLPQISERMNDAITRALAQPGVMDRLSTVGLVSLAPHTPEEITAFVSSEVARWTPIIRASGARL